MFYNVENLFDIYDDTLKDDEEFLPGGLMGWNITRYNNKIYGLYKTIIAAGEGEPPLVVAFCEVESRKALEDLTNKTYLSKYGYDIIHEDSPDRRGIDVCLIYRGDLVKIIDYRYRIPPGNRKEEFKSRSVLYTRLQIERDTIHLFVNHWPSRRGGVLAGEKLRLKIAAMVRENVDSLIRDENKDAKIIITGDFNCTPDSHEIRALIASKQPYNSLVNLSGRLSERGLGTYRYRGIWELIDQVIISQGLFSCKKGLGVDSSTVKIYSPGFLLARDQKYPGLTPFSTYRGYRYQGGFSDHLPILVDLILRNQDQQE
jgi:exonuclease III